MLWLVHPAGAQERREGEALVPPRVIESTLAEPPARREVAPAVVLVTLDAQGGVVDARYEGDVPQVAEAAVVAVRGWRFAPAFRGGEGIPSRIRVEVAFAPPVFDARDSDPEAPAADDRADSESPDSGRDTERDAPSGTEASSASDPRSEDGTSGSPTDASSADAASGSGASADATSGSGSSADGSSADAASGPGSSADAASGAGSGSSADGSSSAAAESREVASADGTNTDASPESDEDDGFGAAAEVEQTATRESRRAAGDVEVDRDVIEASPRSEGAEILRSAPGVYIARVGGDSVGHRIMLRGFDAEHGQDLELRVGHLPVNLPNHIHGQGYADLGFLIPEVVRRMHVRGGVSDPRQGDFAVAGSIDLELGVERRGLRSRSSYGSFGTFRQLALWAPRGARPDTFAAVQFRRSDGFGQNRNSLGASSILQYGFGEREWRFRLTGIVHGIRARTAGVLRRDDIESGRVGFHDVYGLPTAQAQNGLSSRVMVGFSGTYRGADGATADVGVWLGHDVFRLQQNFTGFLERSQTNPDWVGRGDLIEQQNQTTSIGLHARYRTRPYHVASWLRGTLEAGLQTRTDLVGQNQRLIQAPQNETWDERIDASIRGTDIGVYADLAAHVQDWATLRVGARADVLVYEIDDALGNRIPDFRADSYILGYRRSAFGVAAGPRTSLVVRPTSWLRLLASYGEGFRSPQARTLADGETAPYTKVRGGDLGVALTWDERVELRLSGYVTRLSDDVAFEPREGRLERIGASRRRGGVAYLVARPTPWLVASSSLTFVDAELTEPPPATAEDPQPPFEEGQNLPYVPPWVFRLDVGAQGELLEIGRHPLRGKIGVGFSHLSARPLPYGGLADPLSVLDASATIGWGPLAVGLEIYNLADSDYAALELSFPSHWDTDAPRSRLPARHVAAGAPRTVMATLEVHL